MRVGSLILRRANPGEGWGRAGGIPVRPLVAAALLSAWVGLAAPTPGALAAAGEPQFIWRAGLAWMLVPASGGLDWGVGLQLPLDNTEQGTVALRTSLEATWPGTRSGDWEFRLGGTLQPYRAKRPAYGLFYSLRRLEPPTGLTPGTTYPDGSLAGIVVQARSLSFGFYPGSWNRSAGLAPSDSVFFLEPAWFAGFYLQFRWLFAAGTGTVRLAFGVEENW